MKQLIYPLLAIGMIGFASCSKSSSSTTPIATAPVIKRYHGVAGAPGDDIAIVNGNLSYQSKYYQYSSNAGSITVSDNGIKVGVLVVNGGTLINNSPSIFQSPFYIAE